MPWPTSTACYLHVRQCSRWWNPCVTLSALWATTLLPHQQKPEPSLGPCAGTTLTRWIKRLWGKRALHLVWRFGTTGCFSVDVWVFPRRLSPVLPEQNSQDGCSFGHMMSGAVQSFSLPFSHVQKGRPVHAPFALQDLTVNIWGVDHEPREDGFLHRSSAFLPKKLNNACRQRV